MKQSVQELMMLYRDNLFAVTFNVCKNVQDAEDAVQDTFIHTRITPSERSLIS